MRRHGTPTSTALTSGGRLAPRRRRRSKRLGGLLVGDAGEEASRGEARACDFRLATVRLEGLRLTRDGEAWS